MSIDVEEFYRQLATFFKLLIRQRLVEQKSATMWHSGSSFTKEQWKRFIDGYSSNFRFDVVVRLCDELHCAILIDGAEVTFEAKTNLGVVRYRAVVQGTTYKDRLDMAWESRHVDGGPERPRQSVGEGFAWWSASLDDLIAED